MIRFVLCLSVLFSSSFAFGDLPSAMSAQAEALGAPMAAVKRAYLLSRSGQFPRKDVFAVFDLKQPSKNKRLYLFDLRAGTVTSFYSAHGKGNGDTLRATKFRDFQKKHDMTPLGPLKTASSPTNMDQYRTIKDRYDGKVYSGLTTLWLEGTTSYNQYLNSTYEGRSKVVWIIHPAWYVTEAYRKKFPGALGRSQGCIALDPTANNAFIEKMKGGALLYVAVGDEPIEKYIR